MELLIAGCALFTVLTLVGEKLDRKAICYVCKPIASACFVAIPFVLEASDLQYRNFIAAGLMLSLAGDVFLIPKTKLAFLLGLGSFLLAHVAYVVAFASESPRFDYAGIALVALLFPLIVTMRWLIPNVPRKMRSPVVLYTFVITLMMALAISLYVTHERAIVLAGAALFYVSDLSVARDRFVERAFINRAWGLPAYYAGQVLLSLSVSSFA
ncbi:MAG: lysoplasmalogenase [Planctomycetes bacterium]|nr:lysoplasmalogenase [Planctomycetota bacterium]